MFWTVLICLCNLWHNGSNIFVNSHYNWPEREKKILIKECYQKEKKQFNKLFLRSSRPKTRSWLLFCSTTQKYVGGNRITLSYQYHSCYCYYYDMLFQKQISAFRENVYCTLQLLLKTDLQCSMYHKNVFQTS